MRLRQACVAIAIVLAIGALASLPGMRPAHAPEIDVEELARRHSAGAVVLDVREYDEWATGHVPGAVHIPLGEVPDRLAELPAGRPVHVICARGNRSAWAVEYLRGRGIDALNVAGGTTAWVDSGRPLAGVTSPP